MHRIAQVFYTWIVDFIDTNNYVTDNNQHTEDGVICLTISNKIGHCEHAFVEYPLVNSK